MTIWGIIFLAIALAMDCFTVSVTCGVLQKRMGSQVWAMAFLFGLFQALMPLIGWLAAGLFSRQIMAYDHWVAFGLLFLLGVKMIWEGFHGDKECHRFNPSKPVVLLTLAVATSIDALAVGFSFVGMGIRTAWQVVQPIVIIGIVSFLMTLGGKYLGVKIGRIFHWPAEQFGGIILIIIGVKVLIEHLTA